MARYKRRSIKRRSAVKAPASARSVKVKPHTRGPRAPNHGMARKKTALPPHAIHVRGYKRAPGKAFR